MKLEIKGEVVKIFDTQTFASGFEKREFVVKTSGEYPQEYKLEVAKKVEILDNVQIGSTITAHVNLQGKEYQGKYFNTLQCWKIN